MFQNLKQKLAFEKCLNQKKKIFESEKKFESEKILNQMSQIPNIRLQLTFEGF
jgi:hypothetical protein